MPTASDLVTDLPADFEVFGQAVATSMADLLGGTTGQVLSKASNTDMDFTWVAQDDSNAIQNAIVDAKGDLIAATANDTPARLAVGANNLYLVADSTAATGLKYEGTITSFTPSFTNLTLGNGSVAGEYQRIGNHVFVYIGVSFGSTTAITGDVRFALPVGTNKQPYFNGTIYYVESGVQALAGSIELFGGSAYFRLTNTSGTWSVINWDLNATRPFTWGTNDLIAGYFYYEVQ
jgi:hypothetical protein